MSSQLLSLGDQMKIYKIAVLLCAFVSLRAFAFGAYSAKIVCVSDKSSKIRVSAILPFSNAEADGFEFTEGGRVNIDNLDGATQLLRRNNQKYLAMGPSLFTLQTEDGSRLGFIVETKVSGKRLSIAQVDPATEITVEVFGPNGKSRGTQNINCDVIMDGWDQQ